MAATFLIMNRFFFIIVLLFAHSRSFAQSDKDIQAIKKVLSQQETAWNEGNLAAFMEGYWHSDSLSFVGKSGINYGWQKTLDNYKKSYPDKTAMGILHFDLLKIAKIDKKHVYIIGKWHLKREIGDIGGHFTLLWQKIGGKWVIVSDHSS